MSNQLVLDAVETHKKQIREFVADVKQEEEHNFMMFDGSRFDRFKDSHTTELQRSTGYDSEEWK